MTRLFSRRIIAGALALVFSLSSANAQLGGLFDEAKRRAEREAREAAEQAVGEALFPLEQDGADLREMSLLLDRYAPLRYDDTARLERTATGGFILQPGSYRFQLQSYCLKPGAYGRPGGNGYMSGTLSGKLGPYMRDILANSYANADIPQTDIQRLIWGLIAGTPISAMNTEAQQAAARLLTPQQIIALNGADAFIPPDLSNRARRNLPRAARQAWDAQVRLRRAAANPTASYADLEEIAVRDGEPPTTDDDVPKGRWNWHPDGFFIRYDASGYSRSIVDVVMPEPATIIRDGLGRITQLQYPNGDFSRVTYASDTPITEPGLRDIVAFPVARVEVHSRNPVTGEMRIAVSEDGGFIFLSERSFRGASLNPNFRYASFRHPTPATSLTVAAMWQPSAWDLAPEPVQEAHERVEFYQDRIDALTNPPSQEDVDNFLDMDHYGEGIESIFGGPGAMYEWLIDHHERRNRALAYATSLIESLGEDEPAAPSTGGLPIWEPPAETAHPASDGYVQRLGISGRGY